MASMDKVRSALVQNAREETRVRQIIYAPVVPHGEPRRLHLQSIPWELAPLSSPKKHGVFSPVFLRVIATKTPKKKRRSSWRAAAPQDNKKLCRMIDLSTEGEETNRASSSATCFDVAVLKVIDDLNINDDQVHRIRALNLNRHALWTHVDEAYLVLVCRRRSICRWPELCSRVCTRQSRPATYPAIYFCSTTTGRRR